MLRHPNLKLISSNDAGGYKKLLFLSYGFGFEILGTPPTSGVSVSREGLAPIVKAWSRLILVDGLVL